MSGTQDTDGSRFPGLFFLVETDSESLEDKIEDQAHRNRLEEIMEDTGIGMEPEQAQDLFEPFRQESEGFGRGYEGTGVGLAITKEAAKQMGGLVEVETKKGEGTCFRVRLPRAEESASGELTS
jgi:signal transduction histidine kinase